MDENEIIKSGYREVFGNAEIQIVKMPASGSDRKYFRVTSPEISVICTLNSKYYKI